MEKWDLEKHVNWELNQTIRKEKSDLCNFAGSVGEEVKKVSVAHKLETKDHKFDDGETGQIAKKLTIEIDFGDSVVQPDQDFEDHFCVAITEVLANHVSGLFENYEN